MQEKKVEKPEALDAVQMHIQRSCESIKLQLTKYHKKTKHMIHATHNCS